MTRRYWPLDHLEHGHATTQGRLSPHGDVAPHMVTAGELSRPFDVVLLTVKAYSLAAALDCTRLLTAGGTLRAHRRDRDGGRATFSDRWGCPSRGGHNVQSLRWVRNPRRSPGRGSKRVGTFNDQKLSWPRAPWTRSSSAARCFDKTLAPRARRGWPPAASPRMPGCFPRGLSPRISTKSALIPRFRR